MAFIVSNLPRNQVSLMELERETPKFLPCRHLSVSPYTEQQTVWFLLVSVAAQLFYVNLLVPSKSFLSFSHIVVYSDVQLELKP